MTLARNRSPLATVWQPESFSPQVGHLAQDLGIITLVDLTRHTLAAAPPLLAQAGVTGPMIHLKVSPAVLEDPALPGLIQAQEIGGLWVEIHPLLASGDPHQTLQRLGEFSPGVAVYPILSDVAFALEVVEQYPDLAYLVLKGNEAAGLVGSDSIFTLYAALRDRLRGRESFPGLVIWGGVATPEAAAAFLATGAETVVLESLHWLTDLVPLPEATRKSLAKIRPDHTQLIGLDFGAPHRLFNKGNSQAVKDLRDELSRPGEVTLERRREFVQEVRRRTTAAQESSFRRDELIPLGVEAAFAQEFVDRFGSDTRQALTGFLLAVSERCAQAEDLAALWGDSPLARELGIKYPFIQGAMSWITDVPEFALTVAEAGGLPTVALGMMDAPTLERKLANLPQVMGERPYAVNLIALAENPHRQAQIDWISRHRPRLAVIAAGEPSFAEVLHRQDIEVMYIAPNEDLLRLAAEAGVRYLILEGNEAGGHVGQHTTFTLAQIALGMKRREPELFAGRALILAGGIYNRETAFMAAMLGADGIQLGTAYLATHEIVATGALTSLYQQMILAARPGDTVVSGEATGLRVRSLKSPVMERLAALERDFAGGRQDEASFRHQIETLAAGSLLIAARGVSGPEETKLSESACREKGQFMSGACAGPITRVQAVAELHRELAVGPLQLTQPALSASPKPAAMKRSPASAAVSRAPASGRIAITGMSLVNALGNSPAEVWAASLAMQSGIVAVPPDRWNHQLYYHPRVRTPEKTYCKYGAFHHFTVSRKDLDVSPQDFRTMSHATRMTLWLAARAVEESGILDAGLPPERIAVLISQNSGEAAGTLKDLLVRGAWDEILGCIKRVVTLSPELEEAIGQEVKAGRMAVDDTTLLGRLNCTAGGYISNRYGFMGPSFAVSAACATSLVALYNAIRMIRSGVIDAAIVGGGEEDLTPMHFLEFSALGALAGVSGQEFPADESSRPFDRTRDGMVLGEGGGMIVIESEAVAARRGAHVHAYINGTGASNNNRGLVESSQVSQEIAIKAAFEDVPYGPEGVDLIEAHATSTFQGDVEEVKALKTFYRDRGRTVLSSFKSQIGHNLGASGINSLIRGVLAMQHRVFPPTRNYRNPDPEMEIDGSGLQVATEPLDWQMDNGRPRRLQVNSFGFGGSNYVVHVEEAREDQDVVLVSPSTGASAADTSAPPAALPVGVVCGRTRVDNQEYRLAVLADSVAAAREHLRELEPVSPQTPLPEKTLRMLGRKGVFLGAQGAVPPPLALVFPGQGAQYAGMGKELYEQFPVIRHWMDRAAACADFDLLSLLFHDREEDLQKTRWQQPATFTLEFAMVQYLRSLGIEPVAMAGHSLGELAALATAEVYSFEDGFRLVNKRAICMDKACELNLDPGIMVATDAPLELVEAKLQGRTDAYITNYNAPRQVVIGGDTEVVQKLREEIKAEGFRATQLKVSMAFHSPLMRVIRDELQEFIDPIPFHAPRIPVISNTTKQPFPNDPAEIKKIVMAHLESPVQWISNVRTLAEDFGVQVFLEVGPGDTLSNLITETLEAPRCIPTCIPEAESATLKTATAQLFSQGYFEVGGQLDILPLPGVAEERPSAPAPAPIPPLMPAPAGASPVEAIIQREINAFVLDTFGRFLKPGLLAAIRRDHDPSFAEADLERLLATRLGTTGPTAPLPSWPEPASILPEPARVVAAAAVAPAPAVTPGAAPDFLEEVIRLIMEATGYERDEIEPDMDLRSDLAIRSSRLPVIMDAAETKFGIEIRLEDFLDVKTVRDLSQRIAQVAARGGENKPALAGSLPTPAAASEATRSPAPQGKPIKRLTFQSAPLPEFIPRPLSLTAGDTVAIFAPGPDSPLLTRVQEFFAGEMGAGTLSFTYLQAGQGQDGFDLRRPPEAEAAAARLRAEEKLAGIVFLVDDSFKAAGAGQGEFSSLLQGFFPLLQAMTAAPQKKFGLVVHASPQAGDDGNILSQGLLGLFLSAALEYPSLLFRTLGVEQSDDLAQALRGALDPSQPVIETRYHQGRLLTREGRLTPVTAAASPSWNLNSGDVLVFSGGGYGITPYLARHLAPFAPRVVLLGRTPIDFDPEVRKILEAAEPSEKALRWQLMQQQSEISQEELRGQVARLLQARRVLATIDDLQAAGLEVAYFSCDVTDGRQVEAIAAEIIQRYGRIDGIVHGAGVLADRLLVNLTPEAVAPVLEVKYNGALNLFNAALPAGLRFFVGLSSVAAVQGNRGQTNYTTANRLMSAYLCQVRQNHPDLLVKALMLPPISGGGMAGDPELRRMLEKIGIGYLEPEELAELFCRELFCSSPAEVEVVLMSNLPDLAQVRLQTLEMARPEAPPAAAGLALAPAEFPMVDTISQVDLEQGALQATRVFSQARDLWIADHKPFKFLKYPLVSTIMALETFMETARLLYPYLSLKGVREAEFLQIIEVPVDAAIESYINCRHLPGQGREIICQLTMETPFLSPTGRVLERKALNYQAQVVLGPDREPIWEELPGFPVDLAELDTRSAEAEEITGWYEKHTDMQGRYRVVSHLDGSGPGMVRGSTTYRTGGDFSHLAAPPLQYAHYILESLMQMTSFYLKMRDEEDERTVIPVGIGELRCGRRVADGENIVLEARLRSEDSKGMTWDARALDADGDTLMQVRNLRMHWFSR